ncbi:phosphotransferase family protein [Afifella sp. IM 167]|uniref:phosphotransferase family protein n=1 Tax=Afifella sp. IM 167 TaxID=2033586 RepID=UPI001CCE7580|nr:phosphotransferase family protein [Afifella sp. IM 167]MBZ8134510.1 phosphotransferase family protein [Afifella sp. IM 167]
MTARAGEGFQPADSGRPQPTGTEALDFDPGSLKTYLVGTGLAGERAAASLKIAKIAGGQSNPTYRVAAGEKVFILRKPPRGNNLPGAHQVDREYRVMAALAGSGVPVPEMIRLEEDETFLGTSFYLMEWLDGVVEHDSRLPERSPADRGAIYADKAKVLASLHGADWRAAGLEGFGKEGNFFSRQIYRWTKQWEASKTREDPVIDELARWLKENNAEDDTLSIVHGDYRIGNLMLDRQAPRIIGVLDWELSTLGHPLADLAHAVSVWFVKPEEYGGLFGCDLEALGIPGHRAFEAAYLEAAGAPRGLSAFHYAFALFRFAVIFEGIASRAKAGTAASENAETVGALAPILARRAADILAGELPID